MEKIQVQEPRNFCSNALTTNPVPIGSDAEQILRGSDDPSFYITFQNSRHAEQEPALTLNSLLESYNWGPSSRLTTAPDELSWIPELLNHPHFRSSIKQMAREEAGGIHSF